MPKSEQKAPTQSASTAKDKSVRKKLTEYIKEQKAKGKTSEEITSSAKYKKMVAETDSRNATKERAYRRSKMGGKTPSKAGMLQMNKGGLVKSTGKLSTGIKGCGK